jgi:hypothetical protein
MERVTDSTGREYQRSAETQLCYHVETPGAVLDALERAFQAQARVRVFLGDAKSGRDWLEENDVTGRIGRSTGTVKIPLLCANERSSGGGGLLDHCIVRLLVNGREVYRHENYHQPAIVAQGCEVLAGGEVYARCSNANSAERLAAFMRGERQGK